MWKWFLSLIHNIFNVIVGISGYFGFYIVTIYIYIYIIHISFSRKPNPNFTLWLSSNMSGSYIAKEAAQQRHKLIYDTKDKDPFIIIIVCVCVCGWVCFWNTSKLIFRSLQPAHHNMPIMYSWPLIEMQMDLWALRYNWKSYESFFPLLCINFSLNHFPSFFSRGFVTIF